MFNRGAVFQRLFHDSARTDPPDLRLVLRLLAHEGGDADDTGCTVAVLSFGVMLLLRLSLFNQLVDHDFQFVLQGVTASTELGSFASLPV